MKTILLLEDDLNLGALYHEELSDEGYHLLRARDGREALEKLAAHRPDLIVLELNLPGMEDVERTLAAWPGLPIIINSGYSCEGESCHNWASALVLKSSNLSELKLRIQQVLEAHEPRGNA